jgi:hypothetical protein
MNELVATAIVWLREGDLSPHDVGFKLNDTLISSLPSPSGSGYGKPREAFKALPAPDGL